MSDTLSVQEMRKLRGLLEVLGGNPDQRFSEPYKGNGVLELPADLRRELYGETFGEPGLEVYGTPATASQSFENKAGLSTTIIDEVFRSQYGMYQPVLADLTERRSMGDGQGNIKNYIEVDPPLPPEELAGALAPTLAVMSSRGYSVKPQQYGIGFRLDGIRKRDSQLDEAAWIVNEIGGRFAYWPEREMIRLVLNPANWLAGTPMFLGADGIRFFATSTHTWGTSGETTGDPVPTAATVTWGNTTAGTGSGTSNAYTSEAEVLADFHSARTAILNRTDAHGEFVNVVQDGGQWYAITNTATESTDLTQTSRWLRAAFEKDSQPSDDSLRDGQRHNVKVIESQLFTTIGATSITDSEVGDWVLHYQAPGARPPLFILDREPLTTAYHKDDIGDYEEWAWRQRWGVGYGNAQATQLINANA
ncbi:MAG TPA: hypothetical protein VFH61_02675 [Thermoleophilia bacterium]|nr:hypothetical protein [Thermoleophilia bacterium]